MSPDYVSRESGAWLCIFCRGAVADADGTGHSCARERLFEHVLRQIRRLLLGLVRAYGRAEALERKGQQP